MSPKYAFMAVVLASAKMSLSGAMKLGTDHMSARELANLTWTIDRAMMGTFECRGQSCLIADTAGSTGRDPTVSAEGGREADIQCIIKHNPAVGEMRAKYGNNPPQVEKQKTGIFSDLMAYLNSLWRPVVDAMGSTTTGKFTGTCSPKILIHAKGTLEPGEIGLFIGPPLKAALPQDWTVHGVPYDPDIPGDYCLGLPGGMVAKDVINQAAERCPNSDLFLSGYSQGAMVVRNGLSRATDSAKKRVKGVITFGDPFNGANIKGYDGPIEVYCDIGDGVCTGNFEVALAHLAYIGADAVKKAQDKLVEMSKGGGDSKCCHPPEPPKAPTPEEWAAILAAKGKGAPASKNSTGGKGTIAQRI